MDVTVSEQDLNGVIENLKRAAFGLKRRMSLQDQSLSRSYNSVILEARQQELVK